METRNEILEVLNKGLIEFKGISYAPAEKLVISKIPSDPIEVWTKDTFMDLKKTNLEDLVRVYSRLVSNEQKVVKSIMDACVEWQVLAEETAVFKYELERRLSELKH